MIPFQSMYAAWSRWTASSSGGGRRCRTAALLFTIGMCLSCQAGIVYHPVKKLRATPAAIKLPYEDLYLTTSDDITIHGWWVPAKHEKGTVLFCHGNAGNISHRLGTVKILNAMDLNVLIFDYRGFGKSEGSPSEKGTYRDAEAAWRYVTAVRKIKPDTIILHGRSLGGAVASWLAVKHTPSMLILESTFTSMRDIASYHCSFTPAVLIITYKYNTIDIIKNLNCPLLIIHSKDDEVIPYSHGKRIYNAAPGPKEFVTISGTHNHGIWDSIGLYREALRQFVTGNLQ
ncbi:MAG TPA: alpha/beta hydrolase [Spirochaetota bacterium]|nr:alpha/beta hydrolase [Spirochaetota bacterium]